jgi:DNA repair exonuclease SbcCD nuclease subunit
MNQQFKPDVVVDGGDLVDGRDKQEKILYPVALKFFENIDASSYHILGNHETRGFFKKDWLEFTGYEKPYYFVDIREYRLIFLDGNNKIGIGETSPNTHSYPGYLDAEQKIWLENLLKNSQDKNILVFVHQPPLEKTHLKGPGDLFIEGESVRQLFKRYGVKAVFSGHIEEMCYIEKDGIQYYALEGVHKNNRQLLKADQYKDQGVYYEIVINESGEIEVEMFYKEAEAENYISFIVNSETAVCNNQSIEDPEKYKVQVSQELLTGKEEGEDEEESEEEFSEDQE